MEVRPAIEDDGPALRELQARCPQGVGLVTSLVNTPDFFARAKAWPQHQVFVAHHHGRLAGAASCAWRRALLGGQEKLLGYEFEYFVAPEARRQGVARALHHTVAEHLRAQGVSLSYLLIMEGNRPSAALFESLGFSLHRDLEMAVISVYRQVAEPPGQVRPAGREDLPVVAELLDRTWQGHDFFAPLGALELERLLTSTPAHGLEQLWLYEEGHDLKACLGVWDWSRITRITVLSVPWRLRLLGRTLDLLRWLRPLPQGPRRGEVLRQWCLLPMGFAEPQDLAPLLARVLNLARAQGIGSLFCLGSPGDKLLSALGGHFRIPVKMHLCCKPLSEDALPGQAPLHLDGSHL